MQRNQVCAGQKSQRKDEPQRQEVDLRLRISFPSLIPSLHTHFFLPSRLHICLAVFPHLLCLVHPPLSSLVSS